MSNGEMIRLIHGTKFNRIVARRALSTTRVVHEEQITTKNLGNVQCFYDQWSPKIAGAQQYTSETGESQEICVHHHEAEDAFGNKGQIKMKIKDPEERVEIVTQAVYDHS